MRPGVILTTQFVASTNDQKGFSNYLGYLNREEAIESHEAFEKYNDYMANDEKTSGLFSAFSDQLNEREINFYKVKFNQAQEKGGIMWQHVISFDNDWLKENKIIFDGVIDDRKIKVATKSAMTELLKKEKMLSNAYWTGAIHYNTDNIHVHVAVVEKHITRERGKIKQSSLDSAKSKVVSEFLDRSESQKEISELLRKNILSNVKEQSYQKEFDKEFLELAKTINVYQYGRLSNEDKEKVDSVSRLILKHKFPKENEELKLKLDNESEVYKRAYGEGNRHLYNKYKENREKDLKQRLGNIVLKQIKTYKSDLQQKEFEKKIEHEQKKIQQNRLLHESSYELRRLKKRVEHDTEKAIAEYEEMMRGAEYEQ